MRRLALLLVWLAGCGSAAPRDPRAGFERLRLAVAAHDARLLYDSLDLESRWAIDTVWKYQRELAEVVERDFPAEARDRELGRVSRARTAASSRDFFAAWTLDADPWPALGGAAGLGEIATVESLSPSSARVTTTTGLAIPMAAGQDGIWGYAGLRATLTRWKDAAANDLSRTTDNAALYARRPR